jgi:hypothetical protein
MKLNLITPCSRPENLLKISSQIPIIEDLIWWIVFDSAKPINISLNYPPQTNIHYYNDDSKAGNGQRNYALDLITEGYIYFLDDDTIPKEKLFEIWKTLPPNQFAIGQQLFPDGTLRLDARMPELNHIDSGCCIIDRKIIGKNRWEYGMYAGDGEFYISCALGNEDKIILINEPISIYNALR